VSDLQGTITELVRASIARKLYEGSPTTPIMSDQPCRRCSAAEPAAVTAVGQHAVISRQVAEAAVDDRLIPLPVALHESGHVLVDFVCGGEKLIEVIARPDSGSTWHESPLDHPDDDEATRRSRVRRAIVGILAGAEVDRRNGLSWPVSRNDALQADRMLAAIGHPGQGHDTALAPLRATAVLAVHDARDLIKELGVWLAAAGRLPGPVVEAWLASRPDAQELVSYYSRAFEPVDAAA